jgi:hypothetical protein
MVQLNNMERQICLIFPGTELNFLTRCLCAFWGVSRNIRSHLAGRSAGMILIVAAHRCGATPPPSIVPIVPPELAALCGAHLLYVNLIALCSQPHFRLLPEDGGTRPIAIAGRADTPIRGVGIRSQPCVVMALGQLTCIKANFDVLRENSAV